MPIPLLDQWMASRQSTSPLSLLKDTTLGIEASHYLDQYLKPRAKKEPLLPALGGFPFTLQHAIENDLTALRAASITPLFVFAGLDFNHQVLDSDVDVESAPLIKEAWGYYSRGQAGNVVDAFLDAGSKGSRSLYKFLQKILVSKNIDFMVAPYSASAQLSHLLNESPQFIDAVYASSEVLLFNVPRLITQINTTPDDSSCTWITKDTCQTGLGLYTEQHFLEFCLLLGSSFIRTFPPFQDISFAGTQTYLRDAIGIYNASARNAIGLCLQYEDHKVVKQLDYADSLKRAMLAVHNHVVYFADGKVGPMNLETAPSDVHDFVGHRLPLELYYYIQKGIIQPTVPNWFASGWIRIARPLGMTDSEDFRALVQKTLGPIRTRAMRLLVDKLHRFYRSKTISLHPWFEDGSNNWSISLRELPSLDVSVSSWRIPAKALPSSLQKFNAQSSSKYLGPCFEVLRNTKVLQKYFAKSNSQPLKHDNECLANTIFRFLYIQGYIDDDHSLSPWGKALSEALSSMGPSTTPEVEEGVFLIIEMLRLDAIDPTEASPGITGSPHITEEDNRFITLISRIACVGALVHRADRNYSGPLSRHVLDFTHKISAVRTALRELVEVVFAHSLLAGDMEREKQYLTKLSFRLPFINDVNCGLGLLVRTYLENLYVDPRLNPTAPNTRQAVKDQGRLWFPDIVGMNENLNLAFKIWDAVYVASQNAAGSFRHEGVFADADTWLKNRR